MIIGLKKCSAQKCFECSGDLDCKNYGFGRKCNSNFECSCLDAQNLSTCAVGQFCDLSDMTCINDCVPEKIIDANKCAGCGVGNACKAFENCVNNLCIPIVFAGCGFDEPC